VAAPAKCFPAARCIRATARARDGVGVMAQSADKLEKHKDLLDSRPVVHALLFTHRGRSFSSPCPHLLTQHTPHSVGRPMPGYSQQTWSRCWVNTHRWLAHKCHAALG
jgi:hypothetical protein